MKKLLTITFAILLSSCVPVKIAPKFKNEDYKVMSAKKFQKKLPKETSFIFPDPKNTGEFYTYINKKYRLKDTNVGINVPITIGNQTFYLSYSEIEREDKAIYLPLALIDAKRESNGNSALFEDQYVSRTGYWYIVLTVYDKNINNCLKDDHTAKAETIHYLKELKDEYLRTQNYEELLFTKKS